MEVFHDKESPAFLKEEYDDLVEESDQQPAQGQMSFLGGDGEMAGYTQLTSHLLKNKPEKKRTARKQNSKRRRRK